MVERILHCVPGNMDMGGIESLLMSIYRKIDRNKIQFDFIVHKTGKNFFEDEILKLGGRIYRLPNKRKHPFKYKQEFLNVIKNYKIIHVHSVYAFTYYEVKWARQCQKSVILHSHNSDAKLLRKIIHYLFKHLQNHYVSVRLSPSKQAAKWMFNEGHDKVVYLYNGFDTTKFQFDMNSRIEIREQLGLANNDYIIGCVGRLDWQKDPIYLLRLFEKLKANDNAYKLIFIGDGSYRQTLERETHQKGLVNDVIFTGSVSNVPEYLSALDIFVLPTRYEGLGISLIEAQINGLPVFTNKNVPKEAVINQNMYLLDKGDSELWVDAINKELNVINLKKRKVNLSDFNQYNIETVVKKLQNIYLQLLS